MTYFWSTGHCSRYQFAAIEITDYSKSLIDVFESNRITTTNQIRQTSTLKYEALLLRTLLLECAGRDDTFVDETTMMT